jgi:hypothetical protein
MAIDPGSVPGAPVTANQLRLFALRTLANGDIQVLKDNRQFATAHTREAAIIFLTTMLASNELSPPDRATIMQFVSGLRLKPVAREEDGNGADPRH